ncbi:MAG: class I SAM-dependent methyltransferase [Chitinophagaceae bacterium]
MKVQKFIPDYFSIFINPFYFIRKELYLGIQEFAPQLKGKLLDFGCGSKPYEKLFSVEEYIGVDMEVTGHQHADSRVDVFYNGSEIPFEKDTFDSIFCSEVFEHMFNLEQILPELHRVLKNDGRMLVTVPFCWNEHEAPYDFGRYSSFGIKHILSEGGFEMIDFKKSGHFAQVNFQLWSLYFYSLMRTKSDSLNLRLALIFTLPINLIASFFLLFLPKNDTLYFNNIILVKKKS